MIFPNQDRNDCLNEKNIVEYQVYDYHFRSDDRLHKKCLMTHSTFWFESMVELGHDWGYKSSPEMFLGVLHLEQACFPGIYPPSLQHYEFS